MKAELLPRLLASCYRGCSLHLTPLFQTLTLGPSISPGFWEWVYKLPAGLMVFCLLTTQAENCYLIWRLGLARWTNLHHGKFPLSPAESMPQCHFAPSSVTPGMCRGLLHSRMLFRRMPDFSHCEYKCRSDISFSGVLSHYIFLHFHTFLVWKRTGKENWFPFESKSCSCSSSPATGGFLLHVGLQLFFWH